MRRYEEINDDSGPGWKEYYLTIGVFPYGYKKDNWIGLFHSDATSFALREGSEHQWIGVTKGSLTSIMKGLVDAINS